MYTIQELAVGQKATFSKSIAECDVYQFAGVTGDLNPIHVNTVYAEKTRFGKRLVHGMLTSSFICTVLGMKLPGIGTIHVSQTLQFLRPVFIGDTVTVCLEIEDINYEKRLVTIACSIQNQNGEEVVQGSAVVKPPISKEVSQ